MKIRIKLAWLNREKAIFLVVFALLAVAGSRIYLTRPAFDFEPGSDAAAGSGGFFAGASFPATGDHRVRRTAPGAVSVLLSESSDRELALALDGPRPNPFTEWSPPSVAVVPRPRPEPGPTPHVRPPRERPRPPRPPSRPPPPSFGPGPVTPEQPKPYEVPVNFRAVVGTPDGTNRVMLELKTSGEYRYLNEGEEWPDTGLTILRIGKNDIILRNEKGETFVMLDLFGSKVREAEPAVP